MNSVDKTIKKILKKYQSMQKTKYKLEKSYTKNHKKEKIITTMYDTRGATLTQDITPSLTEDMIPSLVQDMEQNLTQDFTNSSEFLSEMVDNHVTLFTKNSDLNDQAIPNTNVNNIRVSYTPAQIVKAYGLDKLDVSNFKRGLGITVAVIIAYHHKKLKEDLDKYSTRYGLPVTNSGQFSFKVINLGAENNTNSDWGMECCLDVQSIHTVAPYANILVVEAKTPSFGDLLTAIRVAVMNGANVVSMSWGGAENSVVISVLDRYFSSISNVCFVASSGDTSNLVNYPSTSPFVISVGGTNLQLNSDNTRKQEIPWYNPSASLPNNIIGAGNGYSKYIRKPSYQTNIPLIKNNLRCTPDVSLVADPNSGFIVCYNGNFHVLGGTSLSAPLCAGMIAIANQMRRSKGKKLLTSNCRNVPEEIHNIFYNNIYKNRFNYTNISQYFGNFYDVVLGVNGIYPSASGFDLATGLGSLNANIICNTIGNI
jgi:subtilase family serine protease